MYEKINIINIINMIWIVNVLTNINDQCYKGNAEKFYS